jgi:hypothetical protein
MFGDAFRQKHNRHRTATCDGLLAQPGFRVPRILNSRKRIIVALVHTFVFCGVAIYTSLLTVRPLSAESARPAWIVGGVYLVVSGVLLWLTAISRTARERLYFGLCASSAALGLCRQIMGDVALPPAAPFRPVLLGCAMVVGLAMLRASTDRR